MTHPFDPTQDDLENGLPASIQMEITILGAMLLETVSVNDALSKLKASDFILDSHQRIYRTISRMMDGGEHVDIETVYQRLKDQREMDSIGGPAYLAHLTSGIPRNCNIESYVRTVREKSISRRGMGICSNGVTAFADESLSVHEVLNGIEHQLMELTDGGTDRDLEKTSDVIKNSFANVDGLYEMGREINGLATHYIEFDRMTCGLQNGELIIIAARPSMGKTAWAINIAENAAIQDGKTVAIFSLEMAKGALVQRMMSSQARIGGRKIQRGFLGRDDRRPLQVALEALVDAQIFIDDSPAITVQEMRAKARRLKQRNGSLDLIVVDYLQLMTGGESGRRSENRTQEVSSISRGLKVLAKELGVPVVALSQLSRASETRGGSKVPILSDLRESGSIEQDADVVAFIHREEYYDRDNEDVRGKADIIIAKQRNGPVGNIELAYLAETTRFENLDSGTY